MVRRANRGSNKNDIPSWQTRLALNTWMLAEFGNGITAPCAFCGRELLFSEITRDRFPKPGHKGGRYVKGNIRPACLSCNSADGARQLAEKKRKHKERLAKRRAAYAERKRHERSAQESEDRADTVAA